MAAEQVNIIGGGVIAAATAYYLQDAGYKVRIIEKDSFGSGCSHGNCGYVCPSHAVPLCEPAAIKKTMKAMFSSYSPFYVNPFAGPSLWGWLLRFAANCNEKHMMEAAVSSHQLLESSKRLYKELISKEKIDCDWQDKGLLFVHTSQKSMDHYAERNELLMKHFNLSAKRYDAQEVVELEPALKDTVAGGWLYDCDSHLRPEKLMAELQRVLAEKGVEIIENCEVTEICIEGDKSPALKTANGDFSHDHCVLATGAFAPFLAKSLGMKLHIQSGKGYSITTSRPNPCPKIPMILEDHSVAVTPFSDAFRLGSTMEFNGMNDELNKKRLGLLKEGARHYLREVSGDETFEEWFGWRPMSATGLPYIGPSPGVGNAYVAAGHSMLGLSMATATGKLIAEQISGDEPHIKMPKA